MKKTTPELSQAAAGRSWSHVPGPSVFPENGVHLGDARLLAASVPDASIDMVFCDPEYDRIDDYAWLAETAARVLERDGACLAFCSGVRQYDVHAAMGRYLRFVMPLYYVVEGKASRLIGYNAFVWTTPCLWFAKGRGYPHRRTIDTVVSGGPPQGGHKWNKNLAAFRRWLADFTEPGDLVLDPFCGGGSLPVACKELGRRWLAFDLDPEAVAGTRERLARTPEPMFVPGPGRIELPWKPTKNE